MRYQNFSAFKKHLKNAYPGNLSYLYLVLAPDDYERRIAIGAIVHYLPAEQASVVKRLSSDSSFEAVLAELQSPSLFDCGRASLVVIDFSKEIKKREVESLGAYLAAPQRNCRLIIGASSKQNLAQFYSLIEKEGVIFDLSEEKKWEKEKRLSEGLQEKVRDAGKTIAADALSELLRRLDKDQATFDAEADKLLVFAGERREITKADVLAISSSSQAFNLWQMAEAYVWKQDLPGDSSLLDASHVQMLFSLMRGELRMGYKLKVLQSQGSPLHEIGSFFPGVWPKALEKKREWAAFYSASYFRKGLIALFEIELLAKNGGGPAPILLDLFYAKTR